MPINESMLLLDEALIDAESGIQREVQPGKKVTASWSPTGTNRGSIAGPG